MFNLGRKKAKNERDMKELIFKKMFNSASHKKMVVKAAKKSSVSQAELIKRYDKLFSN